MVVFVLDDNGKVIGRIPGHAIGDLEKLIACTDFILMIKPLIDKARHSDGLPSPIKDDEDKT